MRVAATAPGTTIPSTAAARRMGTAIRRTGMVVQRGAILCRTGRQVPEGTREMLTVPPPGRWTAEAIAVAHRLGRWTAEAIAVAHRQAPWIGVRAEVEEIGLATAVYRVLRPGAAEPLVAAVPVQHGPAVRAAHPASEAGAVVDVRVVDGADRELGWT